MWKKPEPFEEKEMVVEGTQVIEENYGNKLWNSYVIFKSSV